MSQLSQVREGLVIMMAAPVTVFQRKLRIGEGKIMAVEENKTSGDDWFTGEGLGKSWRDIVHDGFKRLCTLIVTVDDSWDSGKLKFRNMEEEQWSCLSSEMRLVDEMIW